MVEKKKKWGRRGGLQAGSTHTRFFPALFPRLEGASSLARTACRRSWRHTAPLGCALGRGRGGKPLAAPPPPARGGKGGGARRRLRVRAAAPPFRSAPPRRHRRCPPQAIRQDQAFGLVIATGGRALAVMRGARRLGGRARPPPPPLPPPRSAEFPARPPGRHRAAPPRHARPLPRSNHLTRTLLSLFPPQYMPGSIPVVKAPPPYPPSKKNKN